MIKNEQTLKKIGSIISLAQSIAHQTPNNKNKEPEPAFLTNLTRKELFIKLIYMVWMSPKDSFFKPRKKEGKSVDKKNIERLFSKYEQYASSLYRKTKTKTIKNIVNPKIYNGGEGHWFSERSHKKVLNFWARAEKACPEAINKFFEKTKEFVKSKEFSESIIELENFLFEPPFYRRKEANLRPLVEGVFNLCLKNALGSKKYENALVISNNIMPIKYISNNFKNTINIINPTDYSVSIVKSDLLKKQSDSKTTNDKTFSLVSSDILKSQNIESFSKQDFHSPDCIINDKSFGISPFYFFSQDMSSVRESPATKANVEKYTSLLNKGGAYFLLLNRYQLKNIAFDELIESGLIYAARVLDVVILCFSPNTPETKNPELVYFEDLETRFKSLQTEYKEIYSKDSISLRESTSKYLKLFEKELNKTNPEIVKTVSEKDLKKRGFSIPRFFAPTHSGDKLGDHCKILKGAKPSSKEGLVISGKDLGGTYLKPIDTTLLSKEETIGTKKISETCVLLFKTQGLKPTLFEYKDKPIHIKNGVVAIKAKNDTVLNKYLIIELLSEDVQSQSNYITKNTAAHLTNKDVLDLVIDLRPIEDQEKQIKDVERISGEYQGRERVLKEAIEGKSDREYQKIKSLRHHIEDHALYAKTNLNLIKRLTKNYSEEKINEFFKDSKLPLDLKTRIDRVISDIDDIHFFLKKLKDGAEYTEKQFPLTFFNVRDFKALVEEIKDYETQKFKIEVELNYEEESDQGVYINEKAFKVFLREFIKNSDKHAGFNKKNEGENKFKVEAKRNDKTISLSIMDNGKGLGKMTKEMFIKWGKESKNGSGIGGSDIYDIAKLFKVVNWHIDKEDPDFSAKFVFEFPLETK